VEKLEAIVKTAVTLLDKYKANEINDDALTRELDSIIREVTFARNARVISYPVPIGNITKSYE
jgi:hypothetical protein